MKISTLIIAGFLLIICLFSFTTLVNFQQAKKVKENTNWLSRSQLIIRLLSRFQRNTIDMESGLRGYLLTGEDIFLDPYNAAASENHMIFDDLDSLMPDTSFQKEELYSIKDLHEQWKVKYAGPLIDAKRFSGLSDSSAVAFQKLYYDKPKRTFEDSISRAIRNRFRDFSNHEYTMREKRRKILDASVASTNFLTFSLTTASIIIAAGVAFYIARIISRRINSMVLLADSIAKGNFTIKIEDSKKDELGNLSRSLNNMSSILQENISELERKNKELDQFAHIVSHDLKAPLRGIENVTNWIEEDHVEELPKEVKDYLGVMRGRIKRMESLIDGILEITRVGKEKKHKEEINVRLMIEEIVELLSPRPGVHVHINPNLPVIYSEKVPLQQVFSNLIGNAIKYNEKVQANVYVSHYESSEYYEFSIKDDGPGIEPQYHEKIFQLFQTLKERDAFESTGVGLAIVRKILQDKKGNIRVVSQKDSGSEFIFAWPKENELS